MAYTWFRFYNDAVHNPKVQRLPPVIFRFWVNVLCLASSAGGPLPDQKKIEFATRLKPSQVAKFLDRLISENLIDKTNQGLIPHNWDARQFKSDCSTDRVKRFRNVSKTVSETGPDSDSEQTRSETTTEVVAVDFFDAFFKEMPRPINRVSAQKAFLVATTKMDPAYLVASARQYASHCKGFDDRFILSPVRWLQDERWTDFPPKNGRAKDPENEAFQKKMREKYGY